MKILAVLSALATIAIAAPAAEDYADNIRFSPGDFIINQREKKSTLLETQKNPEHTEEHTENHDARTFSGFKKPIIVQKKIGYQVYRNSDEEQSQLDSQEKCRKQMKVKFCDDNEAQDKAKSASIDHPHEEISDKEMVHNIHVAKEAVHTFERDLQRMEHECAENHKHRHTMLGSDTELQHDVEKARQALEHIHRKLKNFDSLNEETTSKAQFKAMKTDEERRTQWKEAGKLHNNFEISKNLEDNFKHTGDEDVNKDFKTTIEDIDTSLRSNKEVEDGMTSIVEDKNRKLKIHSDSLVKATTANEGDHLKQETLSKMEHQGAEQKEMTAKSADPKNHEVHDQKVDETKERVVEGKDDKLRFVETKGKDLNLEEKETRNNFENTEFLKSADDHSSSAIQAKTNLEKELDQGHTHEKLSHENDQVMHGTNHADTILNTNSKTNMRSDGVETTNEGVDVQNDKNNLLLHHDNIEQRTKDTEFVNRESQQVVDNRKDIQHEIELQRSTQMLLPSQKTETHHLKSENEINMDTPRSTITTSKLDKDDHLNHMDNHANNDLALLRATSDVHKELLNNMDFIEDTHHTALHHPFVTDKSQMMKNEKQELHERLNVPGVHPNSEHLKTMMRFSDNLHRPNPELKMASMFNNQEPDLNVQFNTPQDFVEQTNIQDFTPFRTTGNSLDNMALDKGLKPIHDKDAMPTLHDPLTVHRTHLDHMRADESSQHFHFEQPNSLRSNPMSDHQHFSLSDQLRMQQKWAQAKSMNHHQLSPVNANFEHFHSQDALAARNNGHHLMMHEKSNVDSSMQPSSFMQMRGTPKTALERTGSNQWAHTHDAYRSSYGPSLPASYGYGGGSSSGGSAVGVFPNANVGNCAVPILLSCSPSVVSGTLTKTQNAYSAPAYRSEDVNFLKKRGINKDEATQGLQLRHTPLDQRTKVILEKKE